MLNEFFKCVLLANNFLYMTSSLLANKYLKEMEGFFHFK